MIKRIAEKWFPIPKATFLGKTVTTTANDVGRQRCESAIREALEEVAVKLAGRGDPYSCEAAQAIRREIGL